MNNLYLVLGDWSKDGNRISEKILLQTNLSLKKIQDTYKKSCILTGINFHDICNDDRIITKKTLEKLYKYGLTTKLLEKMLVVEIYNGEVTLNVESFVNLWIWFVKLSNKKAIIKPLRIKCINGFWDQNLNENFGSGLF